MEERIHEYIVMEGKDIFIKCNFLSLNVKGIREKSKRAKICTWCKDKGADIFFFYKKHKVQLKLKRLGNCYGMGVHGTNHSKGVLILKMKLSSGHAIAL